MPRPTIRKPIGPESLPVGVIAPGFCRRYLYCRLTLTRPPWKALADMDTQTSHQPTKRVEDDTLLRGTGRYMADAPLPGQTYACFVRSQHACADIKSIDTQAALAIKGVIAVITAADIKATSVGNLSQHPPVAGGGAGRRRGRRGRLRPDRCDLRSARRREAGRAAGLARSAGQHRGRLGRPCGESR